MQKVLLNKAIYFFLAVEKRLYDPLIFLYAWQVCIYTKKKSQVMNVLLVLTF